MLTFSRISHNECANNVGVAVDYGPGDFLQVCFKLIKKHKNATMKAYDSVCKRRLI